MLPIMHIGTGKEFGELALKVDPAFPNKIIQRAATNCIFATMSQNDYQDLLHKIDEKNTEKKIDFFKNVAFMNPMSRTQILRAIIGLEKKSCIRGQVICKEGAPATHVYIVFEGEFELTKLAKLDI